MEPDSGTRSDQSNPPDLDAGIVQCRNWTFAWARRRGKSAEIAEDIAQELACRLTEYGSKAGGYRPGRWLQKLAMQCAMQVEADPPPGVLLEQAEPLTEGPSVDFLEQERVNRVLQDLSRNEHIAVLLCDGLNFPASRVGGILRLAPAHVQTLRHRARAKLRTRLAGMENIS